ncbi:hypothetical protein [Rhizobium sp. PL01]|uniref:hypothetical protein n=1 Tax=Rhizobium sp. PL01 TaxID=3085631 RepID=UPI002982A379|nr:hypothetical protein [Rhizobium sp. PL01]MDW5318488.1 hypothetical protein [Rhizobium sp. PL01]
MALLHKRYRSVAGGLPMMNACFKLSVFKDGLLLREPTAISDVALREVLLIASDFNETRVNSICIKVGVEGRCELWSEFDQRHYLIEKILAS